MAPSDLSEGVDVHNKNVEKGSQKFGLNPEKNRRTTIFGLFLFPLL